jgi:periplasmic mercuric ion binding protein
MKKIMSSLSLSLAILLYSCSASQSGTASLTTESFKVSGVCGMCKKRIETAAYGISGVEKVTWNAQKQAVEVAYNAKKATNEAIQKRIAAAGHDTEKVKAADKAYGTLPDCCKYRDGVEVHEN